MVKKKLTDSERSLFQNVFNMLISKDSETSNLGFELAKQEINLNIGIKYVYRNNFKKFYSIRVACFDSRLKTYQERSIANLIYILDIILGQEFYYL